MTAFQTREFPRSRIATADVCAVGLKKHHVTALLEIDVTAARLKVRELRKGGQRISFTAWLVSVISKTIREHSQVAAFPEGKRKVVVFDTVNVSIAVEKVIDGQKVPIPVVIEQAQERNLESITWQIEDARNLQLTKEDIVLRRKTKKMERLYYYLPGFMRRWFWYYLLSHPRLAFSKMGNVSVTSLGMIGRANGWFIPISVHPVCFGIGNITKKPVVVHDRIEIREILNLSVLLDHAVTDGGMMARFLSDLSHRIETGAGSSRLDE
jgi:pyruvate/2-oxoglutarate dehydrogenase complex dihydrolipoamide acyltransferase (E2) component